MGEQELAIQNNSRNKQHITLAIFVLVLFFSLFLQVQSSIQHIECQATFTKNQ